MKYNYGCYYCRWLNTSRYKESTNGVNSKLYGCDCVTKNGVNVVGWVMKDSDLKNQGCSHYEERPPIIKSNDYYMIFEALQVDDKPMYNLALLNKWDYESSILYSNSLEVLELEMEKLTRKQSGIEQLQLF